MKTYPTIFGFLAILFWSTTFAFSRKVIEQLGIYTASASIFILSGLIGILWISFKTDGLFKELSKLSKRYFFVCGALFVIYMISLYLAIGIAGNRDVVIELSLLNYLWCGLILIFSIPILKYKGNFLLIPSITLSLTGVFFSLSNNSFSWHNIYLNLLKNPFPYLLSLVAAISWGLYSNLTRKLGGGSNSNAIPVFMIITGLIFLIIRLLIGEHSIWSWGCSMELLYLALFPTLIAYSLWDIAMKRGNIILVSSASYFTPLLSTISSSLYLSVPLGLNIILACILITAGAFLGKLAVKEI